MSHLIKKNVVDRQKNNRTLNYIDDGVAYYFNKLLDNSASQIIEPQCWIGIIRQRVQADAQSVDRCW